MYSTQIVSNQPNLVEISSYRALK